MKAQLSQPFMKSHSGRLKPRVSRKRGTGCLPLTVLVPTLHIPGTIWEKTKIPAGTNLMPMDLLYLFIQDSTDLNTVNSDPQPKDTSDMLWAWQLHVKAQVISLQTTQAISLQHNHAAQLTLLTGWPPPPDYQQNFTRNAKQEHLFHTTQAISDSFQTESSKTLPLVRCFTWSLSQQESALLSYSRHRTPTEVIRWSQWRANCSAPVYSNPLWDAVRAFKSVVPCTELFTTVLIRQMGNNATLEAIMQLAWVVTSQFFLHLQQILFQKIILMLLWELWNCYNGNC